MRLRVFVTTCLFMGASLLIVAGQEPRYDVTAPEPSSNPLGNQAVRYNQDVFELASDQKRVPIEFVAFGGVEKAKQRSICEDSAVLQYIIGNEMPNESFGPAFSNRQSVNGQSLGITVKRVSSMFGVNGLGGRGIYVDGQGLVLMFQSPLPMAAEAGALDQEPKKSKPDEASEWEKAKAALTQSMQSMQNNAFREYTVMQRPTPPAYNEEYVSALDSAVKKALAQAGNFRDLDKNDSITVYFYGPSKNSGERSVMAWRVSVADAKGDKSIPESKIESHQYVEPSSGNDAQFYYGFNSTR